MVLLHHHHPQTCSSFYAARDMWSMKPLIYTSERQRSNKSTYASSFYQHPACWWFVPSFLIKMANALSQSPPSLGTPPLLFPPRGVYIATWKWKCLLGSTSLGELLNHRNSCSVCWFINLLCGSYWNVTSLWSSRGWWMNIKFKNVAPK